MELDGNTAHGSTYTYGTTINDGTGKYYYTDIKGSKPIKDPRIGAHFGSQRHRISSIQLLEQETATHGKDVFSIDGRDWLRIVGGTISDVMMLEVRIYFSKMGLMPQMVISLR